MAELIKERYANALLEVALEEQKAEEIKNELSALYNIFKENEEIMKLCSSPVVSREEKQSLMDGIFHGKVSGYTLNFLKVLCENDRFKSFFEIKEEFERAYNEKNNIVTITAVTAAPLTDELYNKLKAKLEEKTGKTVILERQIDKSLIGGILLKGDGFEVDSTAKTALEGIKQAIKQTDLNIQAK